jgi:hypothetical protein
VYILIYARIIVYENHQSVFGSQISFIVAYILFRIVERKQENERRKVVASPFPPHAFNSRFVLTDSDRSKLNNKPLTFYLQAWFQNNDTEVLFITILNNWRRSWYLEIRKEQVTKEYWATIANLTLGFILRQGSKLLWRNGKRGSVAQSCCEGPWFPRLQVSCNFSIYQTQTTE